MSSLFRCCAVLLTCAVLGHSAPLHAQTVTLQDLEAAARQGDVAAQRSLGLAYHEGQGVLQNYARAAELLMAAAQAGDRVAQGMIGQYLFTGLGLERDPEEALVWLRKAAQDGDPQALFDYAAALEQSTRDAEGLAQAAQIYQRAAERGHVDATVSLAVMLQNGTGVAQDYGAAKTLYERAAEVNHPRALNNLGLLYVRGNGVAQDYDRAAALFSAAADLGLQKAMTNLGVMYENGFGVPQSDAEAARLYRLAGAQTTATTAQNSFVYDPRLREMETDDATFAKVLDAAKTGDPISQFQAGWLSLSRMEQNPQFALQAETLFRSAATKGSGAAMANLAVMYERGLGVPQDYALAQSWLIVALFYGFEDAREMSANLASKMSPQLQNEAQEIADNFITSGFFVPFQNDSSTP